MSSESDNIEARLAAYVDGELPDSERAEIEKYLANNPQQAEMMRDLARGRELLMGMPRESAPAEIMEAIQSQLERGQLLARPVEEEAFRGGRWRQVLAAAAIFMLAVGLAGLVYWVTHPPGIPKYTAAEMTPGKEIALGKDARAGKDIAGGQEIGAAKSATSELANTGAETNRARELDGNKEVDGSKDVAVALAPTPVITAARAITAAPATPAPALTVAPERRDASEINASGGRAAPPPAVADASEVQKQIETEKKSETEKKLPGEAPPAVVANIGGAAIAADNVALRDKQSAGTPAYNGSAQNGNAANAPGANSPFADASAPNAAPNAPGANSATANASALNTPALNSLGVNGQLQNAISQNSAEGQNNAEGRNKATGQDAAAAVAQTVVVTRGIDQARARATEYLASNNIPYEFTSAPQSLDAYGVSQLRAVSNADEPKQALRNALAANQEAEQQRQFGALSVARSQSQNPSQGQNQSLGQNQSSSQNQSPGQNQSQLQNQPQSQNQMIIARRISAVKAGELTRSIQGRPVVLKVLDQQPQPAAGFQFSRGANFANISRERRKEESPTTTQQFLGGIVSTTEPAVQVTATTQHNQDIDLTILFCADPATAPADVPALAEDSAKVQEQSKDASTRPTPPYLLKAKARIPLDK